MSGVIRPVVRRFCCLQSQKDISQRTLVAVYDAGIAFYRRKKPACSGHRCMSAVIRPLRRRFCSIQSQNDIIQTSLFAAFEAG